MQIAQPAGRFLDVGLQMIERALEFFVAFARELAEVASERAGLALEESGQLAFELGVKLGRTGQHAAVEQADAQLDVALVDFGAFGNGAHRMAQAQTGVPEQANEFGERVLDAGGLRLAFDQDEHVHVGEREQLAAPEATHRQHGDAGIGDSCERRLKGIDRHLLDERGKSSQHGSGVAGGEELLLNLLPGRA